MTAHIIPANAPFKLSSNCIEGSVIARDPSKVRRTKAIIPFLTFECQDIILRDLDKLRLDESPLRIGLMVSGSVRRIAKAYKI